MKWLRGPVWDCWWVFLGGPLIGVAMSLPGVPVKAIVVVFLVFNTAHLVAPIVTAWTHTGFRSVMIQQRGWFIWLPTGIITVGAILGWLAPPLQVNPITLTVPSSPEFFRSPVMPILVIYFFWNIFHFGMQNYGLVRIYWPQVDRARAMQWCMLVTISMLTLIPDRLRFLFMTMAIVSFSHSLAALGVAAHVWAKHHGRSTALFLAVLLACGGLTSGALMYAPAYILMVIIALRATAGFVHFLYDRWLYQFSDPLVRATIGRELFA